MTEPIKPRSIWCGVTQSGDIQAMHFHKEGIESFESVSTRNGGSITETIKLLPVLYEPAVPRCATCSRFLATDADCKSPFQRGWCEPVMGTVNKWPMSVPVDGSGYCHEHSSLK